MLCSQYKTNRLAQLMAEPWGDKRIPDLQELFAYAKPKSVLEIGCYRGVSTEFWLLHCARVVAIDPWPDPAVYRDFLARCSHYPNLEDHIKDLSPGALLYISSPEPFDMCYIDGDHSYNAVKSDIVACTSFLRYTGAWIAGHDYHGDTQDEVRGVSRAVDEILGKPDRTFSDGSWVKWMEKHNGTH
jgi:predicted O-methyltransferase YrrM